MGTDHAHDGDSDHIPPELLAQERLQLTLLSPLTTVRGQTQLLARRVERLDGLDRVSRMNRSKRACISIQKDTLRLHHVVVTVAFGFTPRRARSWSGVRSRRAKLRLEGRRD